MAHYKFEHDDNRGLLKFTTHNGQEKTIECLKESHQTFRVGGTATNGLMRHSVIIRSINRAEQSASAELATNGAVILVGLPYEFPTARLNLNEAAIALEYYTLDIEGKAPSWIFTPKLIDQAEIIFINVDCIDGGNNLIKRYRISPYTGEYKVMEPVRGS
jgi:hypothetical protein